MRLQKKSASSFWRNMAGGMLFVILLFMLVIQPEAAAAKIKLNKTKATIYTKGTTTVQLKATVSGSASRVTWKSSNAKVAAVNSSGKVTAKKAGKTVITAKAGGKTAKCTVKVKSGKKIPADVVKWNGHYYKIYESGKTWQQAKKYCENKGGYLVTVTSESEQFLIQSLISGGKKNSYWMGGYVDQNRSWHWVTGESFSYSNWANGQPDNYYESGFENALMIYKNQQPNGDGFGQWNDLNEDGTCGGQSFFGKENLGFICEWS